MNLGHLYYFRKLVEVGSYSRAAKQIFISQPTLSLAISNLEKELGAPLLKKKRNSLELTEEGELFYDAVVTATNALDYATAAIGERAAALRGSLKIGTVFSIQNDSWSNALRDYRTKTGDKVHIELKQGTTEILMHDLKNGALDVIMAGVLRSEPTSDVVSIPCFSQSAALLVNNENPLSRREEVSLKELSGCRVITYHDKTGPFVGEIDVLLAGFPRLNAECDYGDEITLASLVVADPDVVAIACRSWLIDSFTSITPVPIAEAPKDFHRFYISYAKRDRVSPAVEDFVKFMKSHNFEASAADVE